MQAYRTGGLTDNDWPEIRQTSTTHPKQESELMNTNTDGVSAMSAELGLTHDSWRVFDYAAPPDDGVIWVAVSSPETDCDVDDYGRTVGWHTGGIEHGVCMVLLTSDGDGRVEFDAINDWELGSVPAEGVVTHWAPVVRPRHPNA